MDEKDIKRFYEIYKDAWIVFLSIMRKRENTTEWANETEEQVNFFCNKYTAADENLFARQLATALGTAIQTKDSQKGKLA